MIIYTGATFDILHAGHINFLRQCKEYFPDSYLIVSLNTDEFIEQFKGKMPVFNFDERKKLLETVEYVDEVIRNIGGEDSKPAILTVEPDVIIIGSDWLNKDYLKQMSLTEEWLRKNHIALIYIPYTEIISTTEIKKRLSNA